MKTVLVIGGTGFLGSAIVQALAATPDYTPVAVSRLTCDATDAAGLARAAAGTAAIVNAAAGPPARMLRVAQNVSAIAASGGQHVVHVSSMAVYGAATGWVTEDAPLDAAGSRYAAGKIACEAVLPPGAAILRPGIVYGPGGQQWTGRLCRLLRAGRLGDLGAAGDGFCNLVHVRDVAAAVLAVLRGDAAGAFNLATPDPPRWNHVLTQLALAIGATPLRHVGTRRLAVESRVLAVPLQFAKLAAARAGLAPGRLPEPMPRSLLAAFAQHLRLHPARAAALGFPHTPDEAGLAEAAAWFLGQSLPARSLSARLGP